MKNKVIIILLSLLLIIMIVLNVLLYKKYDNEKYVIKESKEMYYQRLSNILESYSKVYYKQTSLTVLKNANKSTILLENLEKFNFPVDDIVSYNGEKCDSKLTHIVRTKVGEGYTYKVNYKCGKDYNYDYEDFKIK